MKKILKLLVLASLTALILLTLASCDILFEDIPPVSIWGPEGNNPLKCSHIPVVDEAIAPTCTKSGRTEGQHCSRCKEVLVAQEVIEALGHTEAVDAAVAPTCTEKGLTAGVHCSVCNKTLLAQEKVPALGHTVVVDAPVEPTCTEDGLSEGVHCSVCETVIIAQTLVKAHGHTTYTVVAVEPTCTTEGVTAGEYCLDCGKVLAAPQTIPANGHTNVVVDAVAPTCTETGLTEGAYCSVCGVTTKEQEVVAALGHTTVVDAAVAPTCTETGLTEGSHCSACGEVFVAQETVEALGHTVVEVKMKLATCTTPGYNKHSYCSVCGEVIVKKEMILPLGHDYVIDEAVAPTCTETGLTEGRHCTRCPVGKVEQQTVPATGHTEAIDAAVPATCTKTGLTEGKHCSVCGEVLVAQQETPVIDHTHAPLAAVEPTCTTTGLTAGEHCSVCGKIFVEQETILALGHDTSTIHPKKDPTCTEAGHNMYVKCTRCDFSTYQEIPATGHKEVAIPAVAPTCTETGLTAGVKCSVCGDILTAQEVVPVLGHDKVTYEAKAPTCTEAGHEAYEACTRCNYTTYVEIPAFGHTTVVVPGKAATCTEDGLTDGSYCSVCEQTLVEQEEIAALGHSYVDYVCETCGKDDPNHYFEMTISEALEAVDGKKVSISGTVSEINTAWNTTYKNITVTVIDENGDELYIYRLATNVALGDIVTIEGTMATHNGNRQIAQGATATVTGHDASYDVIYDYTISEALEAEDGTMVRVTGTVTKINTAWSDQYKNISVTITDENGTSLYLFRLSTKVSLNDVITVVGSMDTYSGARQIAAGATAEITGTHTCSNFTEATCTEAATCKVCGAVVGEPIDHTYVNGVCETCGAIQGVETITASKTVADLITEYGWTSSTTKQTFNLDENVSVKINGGSNTGKAYNGDHIRIYATDSPAGTITISVADGYELASIKITTATGTYAFLYVDGTTTDICNTSVDVSGSSVVLKSVKNGSNGKQVRVMAIEVVYQPVA